MMFVNCKVVKVVDGDTLDVLIDLGFSIVIKQRLRLSRVDTKELNSKTSSDRQLAVMAKNYLEDILHGKVCVVVTEKTEKYGRYLAEVYLPNDDSTLFSVNDSLLDLGYAEVYSEAK